MGEFTQDYVLMWKNWNDFKSKTNRSSFWQAFLVHLLVLLLLSTLAGMFSSLLSVVSLYELIALVPVVALGVRRFNDIGRSPWNWLWVFLPVLGWIILVVLWIKE